MYDPVISEVFIMSGHMQPTHQIYTCIHIYALDMFCVYISNIPKKGYTYTQTQ